MNRRPTMEPTLKVFCWCESKIARIPTLDVRAGRTWSCGGLTCVPLRGHESAEPVDVRPHAIALASLQRLERAA